MLSATVQNLVNLGSGICATGRHYYYYYYYYFA